jgi:hypothetical protein
MSELAPMAQSTEFPAYTNWDGFYHRVAAGALIVSLALPGVVAPELPQNHVAAASANQLQLPPSNLAECVAPSATDYKTALNLVREPTPKEFTPMRQVPREATNYYPNVLRAKVNNNYNVDNLEAQYLGLTVHDPRPFLEPMYSDIARADPKMTTAEYLQLANAFLHEYGVDVRTATNRDNLAYNMQPPTAQELSYRVTKKDIYDLIQFMAHMPAEDIQKIVKLKHIILAGGAHATAAAYAEMDSAHNTFVMNVEYGDNNGAVYRHEYGHLKSAALCGGYNAVGNDIAFAQYNASDYDKKVRTLEGYSPDLPKDDDPGRLANHSAAPEKICAAKFAFDAQPNITGISFLDNYSSSNEREDIAQEQAQLTGRTGLAYMAKMATPPRVVQKFVEQVAELYHVDPNLALYYLATQEEAATNLLGICANPSLAGKIALQLS